MTIVGFMRLITKMVEQDSDYSTGDLKDSDLETFKVKYAELGPAEKARVLGFLEGRVNRSIGSSNLRLARANHTLRQLAQVEDQKDKH